MNIIIEFLRIEIDNNFMQIKLFFDKLIKIKNTIKDFLKKAIISYREFEFAIEFLSFVVKIVILKRVFLRRLFDVI